MTPRDHTMFVPGCFRCELGRDEMDAQVAEVMAENDRYREGLVRIYRAAPAAVARVCDEFIDRSGALLGEIRREVIATDNKRNEET